MGMSILAETLYGVHLCLPTRYQPILHRHRHTGSQPFGTYHPITQQLVWETGFVNFV
jgi:hypothetical protein